MLQMAVILEKKRMRESLESLFGLDRLASSLVIVVLDSLNGLYVLGI